MILDTDKLQNDSAYRGDMRFRFLSDGFFAAETLGFDDFTERAHGPVFRQLYFAKNPNIPIREQHKKHKRMHLDPRHTFKTTAKRIDRVQWICAFPAEMSVLVESATKKLARASSNKTAKVFWRPRAAPSRPIHLMFPELVVEKEPQVDDDLGWNVPGKSLIGAGDLDPTLAFTSPESSQSGWHPLLIEPDDVEDADNSGITAKSDSRQRIIDICDQNENLLRDGGFINICGTRYHPFDWYGKNINRAAQNPESWEMLIRTSLTVLDGSRLLEGEFPDEDQVELHFAEFSNLGYLELREKFYANYESFMCQQQNDPQGGSVARFEERLIDCSQIAPGRVPRMSAIDKTYICWRPRYTGNKKMAKYCEGAAVRVADGRLYVLDAWQGTYSPTGEAEKIVAAVRAHDAEALMIIDVPGSEYLGTHVRNEALKRNCSVRLQYIDWEEDEPRRIGKMERLEPMLKAGQIHFSTAIGKAAECRKQFIHFGLVEQDGIIDCISQLADQVPLSLMRANMEEDEIQYQRRARENAQLSQFLDHAGQHAADEDLRARTRAAFDALSGSVNQFFPSLPGGLDG